MFEFRSLAPVIVLTLLILTFQRCESQLASGLPLNWDVKTCRLVASFYQEGKNDQDKEVSAGRNIGTGFFVTDTADSFLKDRVFLITNKHIFVRVTDPESLPTANTLVCDHFVMIYNNLDTEIVRSSWSYGELKEKKSIREFSDPLVDIIAIEVPLRNQVWAFDKTELIGGGAIHPGEQVYFIGYPLADIRSAPEYVKKPILRHGIVSYICSDTLVIGGDTIGSNVFLIDGFAWPGNSGSPVMVRSAPYEGLQGKSSNRGVVGIIFRVATFRLANDDTLKSNEINSGLSIALPSDRIHELLNMFKTGP